MPGREAIRSRVWECPSAAPPRHCEPAHQGEAAILTGERGRGVIRAYERDRARPQRGGHETCSGGPDLHGRDVPVNHRLVAPQLLGIIGHSGAGKTTLIERLVPELRGRGYRVGVLKHDAHAIELDRPGKDSFRIRESGAEVVAVASRKMVFVSVPPPEAAGPDELVRTLFGGMDLDLVLVEGFTGHLHPKVEVVHPGRGPRGEPGPDRVVAWLARGPLDPPPGVPVLPADAVGAVLDFLLAAGWIPRPRHLEDPGLAHAGS